MGFQKVEFEFPDSDKDEMEIEGSGALEVDVGGKGKNTRGEDIKKPQVDDTDDIELEIVDDTPKAWLGRRQPVGNAVAMGRVSQITAQVQRIRPGLARVYFVQGPVVIGFAIEGFADQHVFHHLCRAPDAQHHCQRYGQHLQQENPDEVAA